jgi:hypothetical protein
MFHAADTMFRQCLRPQILFRSLYISNPASKTLVTVSRSRDGLDASVDVELG